MTEPTLPLEADVWDLDRLRLPADGLSPSRLGSVDVLARAESDGADVAGCESEAVAEWLQDDPEFIAGVNRAKSFRRERLRADVLSLASNAMATLRELVSGPDVPPSVRLRASLAILDAANASKAEELGPTSAEGVQAKMQHQRFIDSLG
jgi:hypothetical protein